MAENLLCSPSTFCRHIDLLFGEKLDMLFTSSDSKISGFTRPHVIGRYLVRSKLLLFAAHFPATTVSQSSHLTLRIHYTFFLSTHLLVMFSWDMCSFSRKNGYLFMTFRLRSILVTFRTSASWSQKDVWDFNSFSLDVVISCFSL